MEEKKLVPKLRFPGFTEPWEQRKLSEVVTINPKTELPDEFKYVDLESVVGTNLLGFQVIKKENAPSRAQRLASYGDVFYQTVRPYQRNNYLFENIDKDMVFSTGYAQLRSKLDSYFLLTLVQNDNFVKVVLDNCTGTSYPAINGSELGKITVQIPSSEVEANQIGKVFRGIDKSITLHQRKLEHLKLKKKSLLQKLFPKEGEVYPELRFPGFTDPWEQRKLKSIANMIVAGGDIDKNKIKESGTYPVIANALSKDGIVGYYDDSYRIEAPAVTVTGRGDIGVAKARHQNFTPVVRLLSLTTAHDVDFVEYAINNLKIVSESTGVPQLTVPQLSNYKIHITSIIEERKIGLFISKLDNLITLHQRKLEHLQLLKKALLQQLFV